MILFAAGAVPVFFLIITSLFFQEKLLLKQILIPFFMGIATFIPIVFLKIGITAIIPLSYSNGSIYFYYLLSEYFVFLVPGLIIYFIIFGLPENRIPNRTFSEIITFLSGFYLFSGIITLILNKGALNAYILFFSPILNILVISATAAIITISSNSVRRYLYYTTIIFVLFSVAIVPWLYYTGYLTISLSILLLLSAILGGIYYLLYKKLNLV